MIQFAMALLEEGMFVDFFASVSSVFDSLRFVLWGPHFLRKSKMGQGTDELIHFARPDNFMMFNFFLNTSKSF